MKSLRSPLRDLFHYPATSFTSISLSHCSNAHSHGLAGVDGHQSKRNRELRFFSIRKDKRMDRREMQRRNVTFGHKGIGGNESELNPNIATDIDKNAATNDGMRTNLISFTSLRVEPSVPDRSDVLPAYSIGVAHLSEYCARVFSNEPALQLTGLRYFRERLAVPLAPPVEEFVSTGIVPRIIQFLSGSHLGGAVCNQPGQGYVHSSFALCTSADAYFKVTVLRVDSGRAKADRKASFADYLQPGAVNPTPLLSDQLLDPPMALEEIEYAAWVGTGEGAQQPNTSAATFMVHEHLYPFLQYEAAWILSLVACGDAAAHGQAIISHGAIPLLVRLLSDTPYDPVREACLSAVGNLTAFVVECRDTFLSLDVCLLLMRQLGLRDGAGSHSSPSLTTLESVAWAFDNLAKGEPPAARPDTELILEAAACLVHCPVELVAHTALNTLLTLVENSDVAANVDALLEKGALRKVLDIAVNSASQATARRRQCLAVRILCAALRSPIILHKRLLLTPSRMPLLWETLLQELHGAEGRPAEKKATVFTGTTTTQSYGYASNQKMYEKAGSELALKVDVVAALGNVVDICDAEDVQCELAGCPLPTLGAAVAPSSPQPYYLCKLLSDGFLDAAAGLVCSYGQHALCTALMQVVDLLLRRALLRTDQLAFVFPEALYALLEQQRFAAKALHMLLLVLRQMLDSSSSGSGRFGAYDMQFVLQALQTTQGLLQWALDTHTSNGRLRQLAFDCLCVIDEPETHALLQRAIECAEDGVDTLRSCAEALERTVRQARRAVHHDSIDSDND